MGARSRWLEQDYQSGGNYHGYYKPTNALWYDVQGYSGPTGYVVNNDVTMPRPYTTPHPLTIIRRVADPLSISGMAENATFRVEYNGYHVQNRSAYAYCPNSEETIPWVQLKTKAMALMNPSKPSVDLPVFIFELKDFPRMLQQLGRVLSGKARPSDVAGGYVAYSFGWAPLISDLGKLLKLSKLIDDRARQLKRLEDRRGLRKKLGKHGPSTRSQPDYSVSTAIIGGQPAYKASRQIIESGTYWATGKVNLLGKLPSGFDERRWLAARAALGLNLSAASLWEAMPWSWLIDYFSNVGDILDTQRGFIPISYKEICVMATIIVEDKLSGGETRPGLTVTGGTLKTTYKLRSVYIAPSPSIHFDSILTMHQTAILGSLASAKVLRSFGK